MTTKKPIKFNPFSQGKIALIAPTTKSQKEIWSSIQLNQDANLAYNESIKLELDGWINLVNFQKAYNKVLSLHDSLHTVFSKNGKYILVKEEYEQEIEYIDLKYKEQGFLGKYLSETTSFSFDLLNGPLTKASLLKETENRFYFIFTAHHIICDGWSSAVVLSELSKYYTAYEKNEKIDDLWSKQFYEYSVENQKANNHEEIKYWVNKYSNTIPLVELPLKFKRPDFRSFNTDRIDYKLENELVKNIRILGSKNGASLYSTLMSAYGVLLAKLTKTNDINFGISSAAQSSLGEEGLVGHLVSLLPVRLKFSDKSTLRDILKISKSELLDAFDNQNITYGELLESLTIDRDPSRIPLINTIFNVDQQYPGQGLEFEGIKAKYSTNKRKFENFELFINAVLCENDLLIECHYNTDLFDAKLVQSWLADYQMILNTMLENIDLDFEKLILSSSSYTKEVITSKVVTQESANTIVEVKTDHNLKLKLLAIWEKALGFTGIPDNVSFFSIGGHSILALDIISNIENEFGIIIKLKDFFIYPTLAKMGNYLSSLSPDNSKAPIEQKLRQTSNKYPVTVKQMSTLFLEEMHKNTTMHNLPSAFHIKKEVDYKALEKTVLFILDNHPALRAVFVNEDRDYFLKIKPLNHFKIDLTPIESSVYSIQDTLQALTTNIFDIKNGPLFSIKLFKLDHEHYVFFFMVHHIIWDGWCFDIFFDELDQVYKAIKNGQKPVYKKEELSYEDYSIWQKDFLKTVDAKNEINFWKNNLSGQLGVLEIPIDKVRPAKLTHTGQSVAFSLGKSETKQLKHLAQKLNTSYFNLLLSVYNILLYKYSNESDILIGTPVRSRPSQKYLNTIGYFVNIVAIRNQVVADKSLRDFITEVSTNSAIAIDAENIPFEIISNLIQPKKDTSRSSIFQTFFSFQDITNRLNEFDGQKKERFLLDKCSVHTDIDLSVRSADELTEFLFEYRVDLFEEISILRLKESFVYLLNSLESFLDSNISSINILPENHIKTLQTDWNNTYFAYDKRPFYNLIEEVAVNNPHSEAVFDGDIRYSYKELEEKSNQFANKLLSLGVSVGESVGLATERNSNMLICLLGILKAGAAYIPLEPSFPQDRLDYMIESSGLNILLTQEHLKERFLSVPNIILIEALLEDESLNKETPDVNIDLESPCYIIYTSGSTGLPKGVELSHRSVTNFLQSMGLKPGLDSTDRLLAVTTLSFDIAVLELYLPLLTGASVYIAAKEQTIDGSELHKIINENSITSMQATPSTWRLLLADGWRPKANFKVLCGGEPFPKDLALQLLRNTLEVWNMYGPTETTVWSTCHKVELSDLKMYIGKPIHNTEIYILDNERKLLPIGVPGEMYIGGAGLALGYKGRSDLTDQVFIQSEIDGGKLIYNTGDLARYHHDGKLECLGRNDGQVKIRGYRIELGEIESVIANYETVVENIVITQEHTPGDIRIVAYIKTNGAKLNQVDIRLFIGRNLPNYMIPNHFIEVDEFPKTLNEKIDKKKLAKTQLDSIANNQEDSITSKTNDNNIELSLKDKIKNIWEEVLQIKIVNLEESFFDLGGHSLLLLSLISKLNTDLGSEISIASIYEHNSIEKLYLFIQSQTEDSSIERTINHTTSIIASQNQLSMYFEELLNPGTIVNNLPLVLKLKDSFNIEALKKAVNYLVDTEEVFRARFELQNDKLFYLTDSILDFKLEVIIEEDSFIKLKLHKLAKQKFDLFKGPLFKFLLFKNEKNEFYFFFNVHHIIWDGSSFTEFRNTLNSLYNDFLSNSTINLDHSEKEPLSSFLNWQNDYLKTEDATRDGNYWKGKLSGNLPVLNLPSNRVRPKIKESSGELKLFKIEKDLYFDLITYAKKNKTTLFSLLLTAYNITLAKITNSDDIIVGTPVSGRPGQKFFKSFGYFVNTMALRSKIDINAVFTDNLKTVQNNLYDSMAHQYLQFSEVHKIINPARDESRTSIYQTIFSFIDQRKRDTTFLGCEFENIVMNRKSTHSDIDFWANQYQDYISFAFLYYDKVYDEGLINEVRDTFIDILSKLSMKNDKSILKPIILQDKHFLDLFRDTVQSNKDSLAIKSKNSRLTYKELDDLSTIWACNLIDKGVDPGDLIGVCFERNLELVVAILGILKAGAGYIPIEPSLPIDRIHFMLENSGANILIKDDAISLKLKKGLKVLSKFDLSNNKKSYSNSYLPIPDFSTIMYIIFTSGSTGNPKGVAVNYSSISNLLHSMQEIIPLDNKDHVFAATTISFDVSICDIFYPLITGASIYFGSKSEIQDPFELNSILEKEPVTFMQGTPSLFRMLYNANWNSNHGIKLILAGEALPMDLAKKLLPLCRELWNFYGPTETTVYATYKKIQVSDTKITIGHTLPNTTAYILDENFKLVPKGNKGLLYLSGKQLSLGYYNNKHLTDKVFVNIDGFTGLLYNTGDLVSITDNDEIFYYGRADGQIKIRGHRVEIGEIESVINDISGIIEAVVLFQNNDDNERLICFYRASKELNFRELRKFASEKLASYMVPTEFIFTQSIPKTNSGKIDRKSLLGNYAESTELNPILHNQLSDTEEKLLQIWAIQLNNKKLSITDDFFDVGGHSLLAVTLFSKIYTVFGCNLKLANLFTHPTVKELAAAIDANLAGTKNEFNNLVQIREGSSKSKIIFFHSVGGNILNYSVLAKSIDPSFSIYGFQSQGTDGISKYNTSVEEMASNYIKEIKVHLPDGPYILCGGSMGGSIAFEVARQLSNEGIPIDHLIMFDTFGPDINIKIESKRNRRFLYNLKVSIYYRTMSLINSFLGKFYTRMKWPIPHKIRYFNIEMNNYRAIWKYKPSNYQGDLILFRANLTDTGWYSDPKMGWGKVIKGSIFPYHLDAGHNEFVENSDLPKLLNRILKDE